MRPKRPHVTSAPAAMTGTWAEIDWRHTQLQQSEVHDEKAYRRGQIEHRESRCKYRVEKNEGASVTPTPCWLVGGEKACRNREKKRAGYHTSRQFIFLAPENQAGLDPNSKALVFIFFLHFVFCFLLFVFIIYHKSWVPLACFTYLNYPHLSSLDWKQCLFFPKPLGHKIHAGSNPKPQSEPRERQAEEEGKIKRWSN